jgi:hypothetical protein
MDKLKSQGKSFDIPKREVWEAFQEVRKNKGSSRLRCKHRARTRSWNGGSAPAEKSSTGRSSGICRTCGGSWQSMKITTIGIDHIARSSRPARLPEPANLDQLKIQRRDRLGGIIHEYAQVA